MLLLCAPVFSCAQKIKPIECPSPSKSFRGAHAPMQRAPVSVSQAAAELVKPVSRTPQRFRQVRLHGQRCAPFNLFLHCEVLVYQLPDTQNWYAWYTRYSRISLNFSED